MREHSDIRQTRLGASVLTGLLLSLAAATAEAQSTTTVVTFDDAGAGWFGPNSSTELQGGNPGAHMHIQFSDFGVDIRNVSNTDFLGDLSPYDEVTISIDVKVDGISASGNPIPRNLVVDFRSSRLAQNTYLWSSVWFKLATLQTGQGWTTYSVTFAPRSRVLPEGWGGYGASNPVTFEPMLPEGVTFADVMAQMSEMAFTTLQPGYFYGEADFDLRVDNITITKSRIDLVFDDGFELRASHRPVP